MSQKTRIYDISRFVTKVHICPLKVLIKRICINHCARKGPYYRDRVPIIGTGSLSQSLWVPIRLGDSGKREIVNLYM